MPSHEVRTRLPQSPARLPQIQRLPEDVAAHLEDAAHIAGGHASGIAQPCDEAELAALVGLGAPLLPIGAQSSVTGGATPFGEVLVSSARLRRLEMVASGEVCAGAGVTLDELEAYLSTSGRSYPPVPTWTAATVGGVVSTNAAGPATFKYGVTRDWVVALTVVLPCGEVLDIRRGDACASPDGDLRILTSTGGTTRVPIPTLRWPDVPKRSAGYTCAPGMDAIDLFIGAEGTLGIIVDATLRTVPRSPSKVRAMIPCPREAAALSLVGLLRDASIRTWRSADPRGIDVAAIEHLDRRSLDLLREDGVDRREHIVVPPGTEVLLFVDLELLVAISRDQAWDEVARALEADAPDTPLTRFCRLVAEAGLLDDMELALPGDRTRWSQMTNMREAVPSAVNARVARARDAFGPAVRKTAADMIVPWARFGEMMQACRDVFGRRGLDYAVWGHISDGNVHPNVLPRRAEDVTSGRDAVLELGRIVIDLGGSPLAEHGVGRHPIKQRLLSMLHGDDGVAAMRRVKQAIDPQGLMAPGVLFAR